MRIQRSIGALALGAAMVAFIGGCSVGSVTEAAGEVSSQSAPEREIDPNLTIRGNNLDYQIYDSVGAVGSEMPYSILGQIVGWQEGREQRSGQLASFTAIAKIKIEAVYRAETELGEFVYLEVNRGDGMYTKNGLDVETSSRPDLHNFSSIEDMAAGVPVGTRLLVIGGPAGTAEELAQATEGTAEYVAGALPSDAVTLNAAPQGLLYEGPDGAYISGLVDQEQVAFGGWPDGKAQAYSGNTTPGFESLVQELEGL